MGKGRAPRDRAGNMRSQTTLCYIRTLIGSTQQQLSKESGVSQTAISDYENGLAMPVLHATQLYYGLCFLADEEYSSVLEVLEPDMLPRPWEHATATLSTGEEHATVNNDVIVLA